jgi:respiratory nitrate reductase gamma subunit/nitrate reductase molybdenum cofactor assembly chaperone
VSLQAASLLLGYPDAGARRPGAAAAGGAADLPGSGRASRWAGCATTSTRRPVPELQAHYTDVFDLRRRCCLYLTYFSYGDTRQRGMALLRFSHSYKGSGLEFLGDELPDHLGVVCEFAATGDLELGVRLLNENRAAIELIRTALVDAGSVLRRRAGRRPGGLPEAGSARPREGARAGPHRPARGGGGAGAVRSARADGSTSLTGTELLLWVIIPYICIATFVGGHVWRYRYDKFGWTTRSSQLYERRLLRWGSPLFHFGILAALGGHVVGLVIPKSFTEAVGISETMYHVVAVGLGGIAGVGTVVGLALLIYRRRTVGPVFSATTKNDKLMYVFLAVTILLGLATTVNSNILGHHDYRETGRAVLPVDLLPAAAGRADDRLDLPVPGARHVRLAAVRGLAVHPPRARLQRTAGLPHPAVHRLPVARVHRCRRRPRRQARLGAGRLGLASTLSRGRSTSRQP